MRCEVDPDWDTMYAPAGANSAEKNEILAPLKSMHFEILVGPDGSSLLSHNFDSPPANEKLAARLRSVTSGFEEVVTGVFHIWSDFTVSPILPEPDSEYTLTQQGGDYHLAYSEPTDEVTATLTGDYAITSIHVKAKQFERTLSTRFSTTGDGLILSSYEATFQAGSWAGQQLSVGIQYASVDGLKLPSRVNVVIRLPNQTVHMPFAFSNCRVKKH